MKIGAYMEHRSKNGTKGYIVQEDIWRAVLPSWEVVNGKIENVILYPIDLAQKGRCSQRGIPSLSGSEETLKHIQELSKPYGTQIVIQNGKGYVKI